MKAIIKNIPILFAILFLVSVAPLKALSAPDDVFTVDGMTFKVLTESGKTGTVQVGDGVRDKAAINRGTPGALNIPGSVLWERRTYTVTSIGDRAFRNCRMASVSIPNSVTSIGYEAFAGCNSLASVTIPNSVTRIDMAAFAGCRNLTRATIPNSVTSIGDGAFYGCDSLTSVIIPNSVTSINNAMFLGCSNLASVTIPNRVISIGGGVFSHCTSLTELWFEGDAPTVGSDAFFMIATGAVAYVNRTATGFPAEGQLWNGLAVRYR